MVVGGQLHAPAALPPGKKRGIHYTGGRVDPRPSLEQGSWYASECDTTRVSSRQSPPASARNTVNL
jgi:hypothetical protein